MALARRLAEFAAGLDFTDLPPAVVDSVRLRTLDILGIALAASTGETAPSLLGALDGWGAAGDCTVVGTKRTAAAPLAILVNGALAHSLDFDDTHAASITHASAVVVPVALAVGEATGVDGRAFITAAVAGYEAIARLGMAASGAFHARGWHATAVCGPFAAALVAGRLEGLDAERLTAALGIAGSFASGGLEFLQDGSWVKRVHAGWAGHAGRGGGGAGPRRLHRARRRSWTGGSASTAPSSTPSPIRRRSRASAASGRRRGSASSPTRAATTTTRTSTVRSSCARPTVSTPPTWRAWSAACPPGRCRSCASRGRPSCGRAHPTTRSSACRTRWPRPCWTAASVSTPTRRSGCTSRNGWRWPRASPTPSIPTPRSHAAFPAGCGCGCATAACSRPGLRTGGEAWRVRCRRPTCSRSSATTPGGRCRRRASTSWSARCWGSTP